MTDRNWKKKNYRDLAAPADQEPIPQPHNLYRQPLPANHGFDFGRIAINPPDQVPTDAERSAPPATPEATESTMTEDGTSAITIVDPQEQVVESDKIPTVSEDEKDAQVAELMAQSQQDELGPRDQGSMYLQERGTVFDVWKGKGSGEVGEDGTIKAEVSKKLQLREKQGWKIHVTAHPADADSLRQKLEPVLQGLAVPHKFYRTERYMKDSEREAGVEQGQFNGKLVTIYTDGIDDIMRILPKIEPLVQPLQAHAWDKKPQHEFRLGTSGLISTRFGGFTSEKVHNPLTHQDKEDDRTQICPLWKLPELNLLRQANTVYTLQTTLAADLQAKFGAQSQPVIAGIQQIKELRILEAMDMRLKAGNPLSEIAKLIP